MIHGIGHDVLELSRMKDILEGRHKERFLARILTAAEAEAASSRTGHRQLEFIAGRFAAKEAISKALGCGIGSTLGFTDMEIVPESSGKPVAQLSEAAWKRLGLTGTPDYIIHISITHERQLVSAFAIVEANN